MQLRKLGRLATASVLVVGAMGVMYVTGCEKAADGKNISTSTTSALTARAELPGGDDVAKVQFTIQPVDCTAGTPTGTAIMQSVKIDDQLIPGNTGLANNPLDQNSAHSFADLFTIVPAGCYDVTTVPLQADDSPSKLCALAFKNGVVVVQGQTTEIFLINQCVGTDPGAIDVISALNHPPILDNVKFADSKFACGQPSQVCLVGHDVDGDPLQFFLTADGCDVTPNPQDPQCFSLNCRSFGSHALVASVYDMIWRNGQLIRIEDWLTAEGYPTPSHGQLQFHIYVDGVNYYPDKDGDGHGDPKGTVQIVCAGDNPPAGYVTSNDDCNDNDPTAYPGHDEICGDGVDNNCDGQVDEGCLKTQCKVGNTCGTYQEGDCQCGQVSACAQTAEGDPQCMTYFYCVDHSTCTTSSDCPNGGRCLINTCCGDGICASVPDYCPMPMLSQMIKTPGSGTAEGPTSMKK